MQKKKEYKLDDHPEFRKELAELLKKYNCEIVSIHDEDLSVIFTGEACVPLNQCGYGYAGADNIGANIDAKEN